MDYSSLGLKIGLEIHQQLASGSKLFCGCRVSFTTEDKQQDFPIAVRRKLRPVAGETGVTDVSALYEFLRDRTFVYRMNPDTSCLVETDEQPPKPVNRKALHTALQICKLLGCKVLDEIHFMRKTVIDGSAVSGFQRTAFVGMNGYINTSLGNIAVKSVSLEEDSAVPLAAPNGGIEYRLDRLGIPLVEIATSSDIKSPEHAKEVAEELGALLRSTDVVRGIGSIRQDINISIENGARIELKGFQELDRIPDAIENEIKRQLSLLEIKKELLGRGARVFEPNARIVTHIFDGTKCLFVRKILERGGVVVAGKLPVFSGLLKIQCGDRSLGKELSDHAIGSGIIHSDEDLKKYALEEEFKALKHELGCRERDAIFIIAGSNPLGAASMVFERANHCLVGVPEETRVAEGTGSRYTRPLPGAGRMYPESDIQPIKIERKYLESVSIPKTLSQIRKELSVMMPEELAAQIVRSRHFKSFETLSSRHDPVLVATIFTSYFKDLSRRRLEPEAISIGDIERMLSSVKDGTVPKDAVPQILEKLSSGENVVRVISSYSTVSDVEIRAAVKEAVAQNPGKKESVIMGIVMQKFRGRVSGGHMMEIVKDEMKSC